MISRAWRRYARLAGAFACALALCGCALRPAEALPPLNERKPPAVRGADGRLLDEAAAERRLAEVVRKGETDLLRRHLRGALASVDSPLVPGNRVRLLVDGPQTHEAMFAAMRAARDHINLQSYIVSADEVGEALARLLREKRAEGVRVNLLYDSLGERETPKEYFEALARDGIAVCEFNPVNPLQARSGWRLNNRNHRKLLIIDGEIGFTGGINISGVYSAGSFGSQAKTPERGWRDTHVRFEGPVTREAQALFLADWGSQAHCPPLQEARFYPPTEVRGERVVRLVAGAPGRGSETYASLLSVLRHAERRAWLTYGYFVPDPATVAALREAAQRGVDVRLVLPGFSDFWAPLQAGRSHYDALLESGVQIHERVDALLHAKTAVIDGVWSTVGSTNLDWRSFVHNYEADLVVFGEDFAAELEALFELDLAHSRRITLDDWRKRGLWQRMKEWFARRWEYLL